MTDHPFNWYIIDHKWYSILTWSFFTKIEKYFLMQLAIKQQHSSTMTIKSRLISSSSSFGQSIWLFLVENVGIFSSLSSVINNYFVIIFIIFITHLVVAAPPSSSSSSSSSSKSVLIWPDEIEDNALAKHDESGDFVYKQWMSSQQQQGANSHGDNSGRLPPPPPGLFYSGRHHAQSSSSSASASLFFWPQTKFRDDHNQDNRFDETNNNHFHNSASFTIGGAIFGRQSWLLIGYISNILFVYGYCYQQFNRLFLIF